MTSLSDATFEDLVLAVGRAAAADFSFNRPGIYQLNDVYKAVRDRKWPRILVGYTSNAPLINLYAENISVGTPGTQDFGIATNLLTIQPYYELTHDASASVFNDIPATAIITFEDPFANSTADGLILDGDPFPLPTNGYTIGIAGEEDFGVGTELDENTLLAGTTHADSGSIM
jgi:hypothetical protein